MKTALSSSLFFSFLLFSNNPSYSRNAEWLVYNRSNSGLPSNTVYSVALDTLGNRWFGTLDGGAARFGGGEWIVYNCHNSLLPDNFIRSIAIENNEILWFAGEGLTRFANTGWYVYTGFNSDFICEYGVVVTIDGLGNKVVRRSRGRWSGALPG